MGTPRRKSGVLAGEVEPYRAWLLAQGYSPEYVLTLLSHLSRLGVWLQEGGRPGTGIDPDDVRRLFAARRRAGVVRVPGGAIIGRMLAFLAGRGLVARVASVEPTPLQALLISFRAWMVGERGLAAGTVIRYERTAGRFLTEQALHGGVLEVGRLTGADVNAFLLRECARVSAGSAKGRVAELRAVLRFLYLEGLIPLQLGGAVPPVGGWRLAGIPRPVSAGDVQRVIDSCDAATVAGARDRAIMLLVARLGLRSVEVARLELGDVDWRRGELTVRGKSRREDRLPLPADVGEALSSYLSLRGRAEDSRRVFFTCRLPHGPILPGLVNEVVDRGCKRAGIASFGPDGLLTGLASRLLSKAMSVELTDHLGYEHGDRAGWGSGNSGNGTSAKTVLTDAGPVPVDVPRDRNGSFEPKLVGKHQRRLDGFNDIVVGLVARGMSTRDVASHLGEAYGVDVSAEQISKITDAILPELRAWQSRPLDAVYPIVYLDAIVVRVRSEHVVTNRPVYLAMGIDLAGSKHVLGMWLGKGGEGSKFWLGVCTELRNRGVSDVLIVCCDGLTGFPEAIETVWPQATVQTCVVHLIRNSIKYISWKDR